MGPSLIVSKWLLLDEHSVVASTLKELKILVFSISKTYSVVIIFTILLYKIFNINNFMLVIIH